MAVPLILASSSPRRLDLLARLGVVPERVGAPEIDETPHKGELPRLYAERMAREKALAVQRPEGHVLLAGDTVVSVGRRILGQAIDKDEAYRHLKLISGRRHQVYSALAVIDGAGAMQTRLSRSIVKMKHFHPHEIKAYIEGGEWRGKAGSYAIQGEAEAFILWMSGSWSGIVGLPLYETRHLLMATGVLHAGNDL